MFKELFESRKSFEGVSADKIYKKISKLKKKSSRVDYEGLEIETIIDGSDYYIVYKGHTDEVSLIIKNPNSKDMKDFENALEAS